MTVTTLDRTAKNRNQPYRLTVSQYHGMVEQGILTEGEPFELIDGQVVRKDRSAKGEDSMTVGHRHALTIQKLAGLSRSIEKFGCHVRTQLPVTIKPHNEPEPDAAFIVGRAEDYRSRHPGPKDALCIVEVADSSLQYDRTVKLRVYAGAGIPRYVIINLVN